MSIEIDKRVVLNKELDKNSFHSDPFIEFDNWYKLAMESGESLPNAMSLATVSKDLQPSLRTVLLKHYDNAGFVFFTNYKSKKSRDIDSNPKVAIKFYWPILERQLIILGSAEKLSRQKSLKYFLSRPLESKIGAWCSDQSEVISSRKDLTSRFSSFKKKFQKMEIPKPQNWGGYKIVPHSFEFWQGRKFRLHDRFKYTITDQLDWQLDRLAP